MFNDAKFSFIHKKDAFVASEEYILYKTIRKLRLALVTHRRNHRTLLKSMNRAYERSQHADFWNPPYELWRQQSIVTTDLLNFLGSKETIINVTEIFIDKHLGNEWKEKFLQYIRDAFGKNAEYCVIDRLRTYLVHYSIPDVGIAFGFKEGRGKFTFIYLHKSQLLRWSRWTALERDYINSLEGNFDLKDPLKRYNELFMDTQDRIFLVVINKYREQLEKLPAQMKSLYQEGVVVGYEEYVPFRPSWIRYLELILLKSKVKGL